MTAHIDIDNVPDGHITLPQEGIDGPLDTEGKPCPWPWEPQQLKGAPIGQYHCRYCGGMVVAGMPHPDYRETEAEPELAEYNGGF